VKAQGILIVEDENIVALDMRMRLEAMGYRVVDVVDSGERATESVARLQPDLVLMDIKLKGDQDGIEAASQLRERSEVPVIFVTAFTDERTLDRAKRASPYGYIVKPFHERELRIAIELAIYKHQLELSIRRARDIAEESNRIKGEFLANMSHELKTPLNSVIGFTELAMGAAKEPEQREYLGIALSSAKSLLTLIDSVLDFARMEAGKFTALKAPFSLDEVIGECVDSLAIAAFSKGLEISFRREASIPSLIVGDRSLLKHVIQNLLDNAVKFTEKGRVRFCVSPCDSDMPGSAFVIEFSIQDTGIGMPKDKIDQAFTRFTQLDPSRSRKAGGTGLGLAIVAKSVELMEGSISVDSDEGVGTRFTLRLPFEAAAEASIGSPSASAGKRLAISGSVALVGFEEEGASDAAYLLSGLGVDAQRAADLDEAESCAFIIVDEKFLSGAKIGEETLKRLAPKLIVATRIGGAVRSELTSLGISFAPLPLRSSSLRSAFTSLAAARGAASGSKSRTGNRQAEEVRETAPAKPQVPERGDNPLARLSVVLERALESKAFGEAERHARTVHDELDAAGDKKGAKLAFSALLSARKGDEKSLKDITTKLREHLKSRSE
jgi:signal transduction histidine kinase